MRLEPGVIDLPALQAAVIDEATQRRALMPPSSLLPMMQARTTDVAAWADAQLSGDFEPVPEQVVPVRKPWNGVRPIAELFLRDQLLYRGLVSTWKSTLPPPERSSEAHDAFEAAPLTDESASHVVSSDIAAYYQYIDYDLLSREVVARTADARRVDVLIELLTRVTGRRFGIPQQNVSSDVLAEAYIDVLERRLLRAGVSVWRYNDDFRITTRKWSDALAAVDLLDREARRLGLVLNDNKTIIRKRDTYETGVKRRERILNEIADEAELDLTTIGIGMNYELTPIPPEPDAVRTVALRTVLLRWHAGRDDSAHRQALVQLLPSALTHLARVPIVDSDILDACMAILRIEQALTPHVAQYLQQVPESEQSQALSALDRLLDSNPYLTPWQASWLSPALSRMRSLTTGTSGEPRVAWLKSVWEDVRAPEPVRAAMAEALARHKIVSKDELLDLFDRMSETSRPALALALGVAGLNPRGQQARALTSEDELIRWQFEWGVANK